MIVALTERALALDPDGMTPAELDGWGLVHSARAVRCYARGGRVTVGATLDVLWSDGWRACTMIGRGASIAEAVADLGACGVH